MTVQDALDELAHDHADLNRRVIELGKLLAGEAIDPSSHADQLLLELREELFFHFAREEEGLFPFVTEHVAELAPAIDAMATAHDAICGGVARMCHMVKTATVATMRGLFERFEQAYVQHSKMEAELLRKLETRLDADQRLALAELVRGL
jgi:iron-sulfur cluster repair protein YtfE (RIC family)